MFIKKKKKSLCNIKNPTKMLIYLLIVYNFVQSIRNKILLPILS